MRSGIWRPPFSLKIPESCSFVLLVGFWNRAVVMKNLCFSNVRAAICCWVFVADNVQTRNVVCKMITVRCAPYKSKISTNDGRFYAAKPTCTTFQNVHHREIRFWVRKTSNEGRQWRPHLLRYKFMLYCRKCQIISTYNVAALTDCIGPKGWTGPNVFSLREPGIKSSNDLKGAEWRLR
jgi:hypothetical protein